MKKKFMTFLLALSMVLLFVGCGKKDEEEVATEAAAGTKSVQEEIVQFVNTDLPAIAADRDSAVNI